MMACGSNPLETVIVAKALGKTIREAEELAYAQAINRCPGFPPPPYRRSRRKKPLVVQEFHKVAVPRPNVIDHEKVETARR
jgi:hypothetical protein